MRRADTTSTRPAVWFGLLAGPAAWTLHELVSYAFLKIACEAGLGLVLHVITLGALVLAGAGVYVALRANQPNASGEVRFLAAAGALTSGLFGFAIVMEGIPNAVLSPCL